MTLFIDFEKGTARHIKQSDMLRCPHYIMVAEHYRSDNSCKCDDPNETVMAEWGYTWYETLAQSVIHKLSAASVNEPNSYQLDAVERRRIIWALQELVRLYGRVS